MCGEHGAVDKGSFEGGALVSPGVVALVVAALVERGHGLIRRPRLDLHEVRPLMAARWTLCVRGVYVLPRRLAAQHVIHLLETQIIRDIIINS